MKFTALTLLLILATFSVGLGQIAKAPAGKCSPPVERCMGADCERGKPVIVGKPYDVPRLRLRVLDENTNKPLVNIQVNVHYEWEWLEYPYHERPFGVWSGEAYSAECVTDGEGFVEVDKFKVEPHGWYKGIYSVGHKPRFKYISLRFALPKCFTGDDIKRAEIKKCKRKGVCEFTFRTSCNALLK